MIIILNDININIIFWGKMISGLTIMKSGTTRFTLCHCGSWNFFATGLWTHELDSGFLFSFFHPSLGKSTCMECPTNYQELHTFYVYTICVKLLLAKSFLI
jgi:hypothetical protein